MKINYQIMKEAQVENGKYIPDYDSLMANASCDEEKAYIQHIKDVNFGFAFNMVYITRQLCGHFEIFQSPQNQYYSVVRNLKLAEEEAKTRKCTRCICKF